MMTIAPGLPALPSRVHIREVGPRDGLQNEDVILSTAQKLRLIDALGATGLDQIEAGAFVRAQNVPQMADTAEVFAGLSRRSGVVYSATSRLSASGKLERVPKPDGQVGYRSAKG